MRAKPLLMLTIVVALFGAYLYFVERRLPTTDERAAQAKKVLDLNQDEVDAVSLAWDSQIVRLERTAAASPVAAGHDADDEARTETGHEAIDDGETGTTDRWRLVAPMTALADATAVGDLVRDLVALEKSRTIDDVNRAEVGLDAPRATVTLHTAAGDTVLEIGPAVPASSAMIVAVAGGRDAYQVPDTLWSTLTQAPGDWRDRQIFRDKRADITQIRLIPGADISPSTPVVLAKRDDDFWLEQPLVDRADSTLASTLLGAITGLKVTEFVDGEPAFDDTAADDGLTPPFGRVEVVLDGREEPFVVEIGAPTSAEGSIYARTGGQVFTASAAELRTALGRAPETWRSPAWTSWQVFDIDRATMTENAATGSTATVTLERNEGEWRRNGDPIDYTVASDVLYGLSDVRGDRVVARADLDPSLLAHPTLTVVLTAEDGRTERLGVYRNDDALWATTEGRDAVLVLAPSALDDWHSKLDALKAATPLTEAVGDTAASDDTGTNSDANQQNG